jgi:tetratricopeptide (TPR) repeat protein
MSEAPGGTVDDWRSRVDAVWSAATDENEPETVAAIRALAAERPDDPVAVFELAGAHDYAGEEAEAEPLYKRALEAGLDEPYHGRAVIQLASTLRNLGRYDEAAAWLKQTFGDDPEHPLNDAASAFMALVLSSQGDDKAATAMALDALSRHLPEYGRAVRFYATELLE